VEGGVNNRSELKLWILAYLPCRVHHMQPQYRIQLLTLLHSCAVPQQHQTQLTLCVENAALRLIGLLGAAEMQPWYA